MDNYSGMSTKEPEHRQSLDEYIAQLRSQCRFKTKGSQSPRSQAKTAPMAKPTSKTATPAAPAKKEVANQTPESNESKPAQSTPQPPKNVVPESPHQATDWLFEHNPVLHESNGTKCDYLNLLTYCLQAGGWASAHGLKYYEPQLERYRKIIWQHPATQQHDIQFYKYYLLLDLVHILGDELQPEDMPRWELLKVYLNGKLNCSGVIVGMIGRAFLKGNVQTILLNSNKLESEREYIQLLKSYRMARNAQPHCKADTPAQNVALKESKPAEPEQIAKSPESAAELDLSLLATAQIFANNPIVNDSSETKNEYINLLSGCLQAGGWLSANGPQEMQIYYGAQLNYYREVIRQYSSTQNRGIQFYKNYILLDLIHILGDELQPEDMPRWDKLKNYQNGKLNCSATMVGWLGRAFQKGGDPALLLRSDKLAVEREYIQLLRRNREFRDTQPYRIIVTATMSAGKSTFINAFTGKHICRTQNRACTSKVRYIINKAYDDGCISKFDHKLLLNAPDAELLEDSDLNKTDKIAVGMRFNGELNEQRIVISDTPGVNYSLTSEHRKIANDAINGEDYDLIICILNAENPANTDEKDLLGFIHSNAGDKPILFVLNKADKINSYEHESLDEIISNQREHLINIGFKAPVIAPLCARGAYLAQKSEKETLSKSELRELEDYSELDINDYYKANLPEFAVSEQINGRYAQELKASGLLSVEKIIEKNITGGI